MKRQLLVTADDFGIGPETTRGILELGALGVVTSTVMLVNTPYAEEAVEQWYSSNSTLEVGWHPCLTLDKPVLPAQEVPSLVNAEGKFWSLGQFLVRLMRGKIVEQDIFAELRAQYQRFIHLMGRPPVNINGHHHVHIFGPVWRALHAIIQHQHPRPYVRRVREPWRTLWRVPGIRIKRWLLSHWGSRAATWQSNAGYPGADWLAGITDPPYVEAADFFPRWVTSVPGELVELCCHPGHDDVTLLGRDATATNGQRDRRVHEWYRLQGANFWDATIAAGMTFIPAQQLLHEELKLHRAA
jgi:predicted glycoside hydrolase/deacetylase ChbG (UPF0249 family)